MEEVAPEYDVVVLGTGTTPPPIPLASDTRDADANAVAEQD